MRIRPDLAEAHFNLASVLADHGAMDEAILQYQQGLKIRPDDAQAHYNLGLILANSGRADEAIAQLPGGPLKAKPTSRMPATTWRGCGRLLPKRRSETPRRPSSWPSGRFSFPAAERRSFLDTLAAAYAEAGRFSEAVKTARTALDLAVQQKQQPLADTLRTKIALYEAGKPFRRGDARSRHALAQTLKIEIGVSGQCLSLLPIVSARRVKLFRLGTLCVKFRHCRFR